jgi:hypothetical protein
MRTVICPACGRHINLPDTEMSLPSIQCARCDNHFCPATGEVSPRGQTAVALPDTAAEKTALPVPLPEPPHVQRGTLVACAILVGVLVLFGVLLAVALRREPTDRSADQGGGDAKGKAKPPSDEGAEAKGVLSDEELVRRYIVRNAPDPARVRFLQWGPHLSAAEMEGLAQEAGKPDLFAAFGGTRQLFRVRYEAPTWKLKSWEEIMAGDFNDQFKPSDALRQFDESYFVVGKIVHKGGVIQGGDHWREQLRRDLGRAYPAIKR